MGGAFNYQGNTAMPVMERMVRPACDAEVYAAFSGLEADRLPSSPD